MPLLRRLLLFRASSTGKSRLPKNGIGKSAKERNETNSCSKTKTVRIHSKLLAEIPSQKIPVQPKRTQTPNSWSTSRYGSGLILHSTVSRLIGADKTGNSTLSLAIIFTFSFFIHEIAHKLSAQRYGLWAEFRLTLFGALITLLSMIPFTFFKIISPGAVMIAGPITKKQAGKTALAGPLTNITISTICTAVMAIGASSTVMVIAGFSALINAIIAIFNLIPFGIFDGFKVFRWNKPVWALAFTASLILTIACYIYIL